LRFAVVVIVVVIISSATAAVLLTLPHGLPFMLVDVLENANRRTARSRVAAIGSLPLFKSLGLASPQSNGSGLKARNPRSSPDAWANRNLPGRYAC
jgi:hypothetical protein